MAATLSLPRGNAKTGRSFAMPVNVDIVAPLAVMAIVIALIMPLPAFLIDLLIVTDIMMSVIVLMVSMYILKPVEFSVFPTTLLLLTLFRLALNVSSTRLILLNGNTGTAAAGHVIEAFGNFVVGGNYIIGTVVFLILIAIQYVVINHGAVRISEVTARFTLDALPGKQMAIDADLNAGTLDEEEARQRRRELAREAEFYGAMDGASRFTQRDAMASVLITSINIAAGFLIGMFQYGMDFQRALETYTVLTIGDGLVTVIPALMISVSGGLIVTRASSDARLSTEFRRQVFTNDQPLLLASGVMLLMAVLPGLPAIPFLMLGVGLGSAGWRLRKNLMALRKDAPAPSTAPPKDNIESLLRIEPLAVEVGLGLVRLAEGAQHSPLMRRIAGIRKQLASDLGYLLAPVRITDNLSLRAREYRICLKGIEIARFELRQGCDLVLPAGKNTPPPGGQPAKDPAFGMTAWWIPSEQAEEARRAGYTVVEDVSILGTHLAEIIRRHAFELFSRQDARKLLDRVAVEHPRVVEDLVPKLLPLAAVQRVVQNLLRERVSIRDGASILEALGEAAAATRNPVLLTEYVRQANRRAVVQPYLSAKGDLAAYLLDPGIEQQIESSVEHGEHGSQLGLSPQTMRDLLNRVEGAVRGAEGAAVLLTSSGSRYFLRQLTEVSLPGLAVISHGELPPGVQVVSLGVVV